MTEQEECPAVLWWPLTCSLERFHSISLLSLPPDASVPLGSNFGKWTWETPWEWALICSLVMNFFLPWKQNNWIVPFPAKVQHCGERVALKDHAKTPCTCEKCWMPQSWLVKQGHSWYGQGLKVLRTLYKWGPVRGKFRQARWPKQQHVSYEMATCDWCLVEILTTREPSEIATYQALKFRRRTW